MATTKRIRINLAALTRVEYSEVLEVPSDMTPGELDDLVEQRYQDVDGGEFWDDTEYWERGECAWEKVQADDTGQRPAFRVSRDAGGFQVEHLPGDTPTATGESAEAEPGAD
jgi:hypothetical protein